MSRICIIPARGGSKRVPGKNIREFCGKPVIAYSIEAALNSGLYDEVMVSTDSEKIAEVARAYGASVPFMRSAHAASDFATTREVLVEVLEEYEKRGKTFDYMTCIYPCAIFVTPEKLKKAHEMLLEDPNAGGVTPVVAYSCPPQRSFVVKDGYLSWTNPQYITTRTQDLEPQYHDCGQFYVYNLEKYMGIGGPSIPFIMPEEEVQDVDNESDLRIAALKYRVFTKGEQI